jgi:hypothetical protein
VAGPHLNRTLVVPAPLAGILLAVVASVALVVTVDDCCSEADVEARTSSYLGLH